MIGCRQLMQSSGGSVCAPSATLTLSDSASRRISLRTLLFYGPTAFGRLTPCVMQDSGSPTTSCCEYTCPGRPQSPEGLGRALAADGSNQLRWAIAEGAEPVDEIACAEGNTGRLSTVADHAGAVPITKLEITTAAAVLKLTILVSSFLLTAHLGLSLEKALQTSEQIVQNGWNRRFICLGTTENGGRGYTAALVGHV